MSNGLRYRLERIQATAPQPAEVLLRHLETCGYQEGITEADTQICSSVHESLRRDQPSDNPELIILLGCPTMAEYLSITSHMNAKDQLLVVEYDLNRALHFTATNLIEGMLREKRLGIAFGHDKKQIKSCFFSFYNPKETVGMQFIDMQRSSPEAQAFMYDTLMEARQEARLDVFNAGTLVCRGPLWQFNTLKNLPHIMHNPGINSLQNMFKDKPAIVVGAGPSLNDALPLIKQVANRYVVIATGTALCPLREAGIRPDIVIAVDGSHLIRPQFETTCDDLYFACSSLVYSDITDRFKGVFSGGLDASPIDHWINERHNDRGMLYAGGTVTCSAMYLASLMGCNTVCTVGLDLCFQSDGTTHASNTMYDGHKLNPEQLEKVPGNYQEVVLTTQQFKCYIDLVGDFVEKFPQTDFININQGGARIKGMRVAPPAALKEMGVEPFNAYDTIQHIHMHFTPYGICAMREELNAVVTKLEDVLNGSQRAAAICEKLIDSMQNPDKTTLDRIHPLMDELGTLDEQLEETKASDTFIQMSLWPAMYEFGMGLDTSENKSLKDQIETFQQFKNLYEQIGGASKWTRDALNQVLHNWSDISSSPDTSSPYGQTKTPTATAIEMV